MVYLRGNIQQCYNADTNREKSSFPGFAHFFRPKSQGLFKDFPGPYFEISGLFFIRIYLQPSKMLRSGHKIVFTDFHLI